MYIRSVLVTWIGTLGSSRGSAVLPSCLGVDRYHKQIIKNGTWLVRMPFRGLRDDMRYQAFRSGAPGGSRQEAWLHQAMEGVLKDGLLQLLQYFHNPELVGSLLLLYVIVSGRPKAAESGDTPRS